MRAAARRSRSRSCALVLAILGTTALCLPHDAGAAGNTISPATGNVLTCSTVQFRSATPVNAQWRSTHSWDSVDATSGLYTAPATAANHPMANVALLGLPGSSTLSYGSVSLPLATAFPSAVGSVPLGGNVRGLNSTVPFEHALSANGQQVYTVALNGTSEADVFVSNDGGLTFAAAYAHPISVAFAPGSPVTVKNITCATVAVDAGNPAFTYLATLGHGGSNNAAQVLVAVSSDGGKTYPASTTYIIGDTSNISYQLGDLICPDVVSPSPGHVVVTAVVPAPNNNYNVAIWAAGTYGAGNGTTGGPQGGLGPVLSTWNATTQAQTTRWNSYWASHGLYGFNRQNAPDSAAGYQTDNGYDGPRLFTNGTGTVCVGYDTQQPNNGWASLYLQCSSDSGATWTGQKLISTPVGVSDHNPLFGSVSPSGKVAVSYLVGTAPDIDVKIFPDATLATSTPRVFNYPSASRNGIVAGAVTTRPVLAWEGDNVLWLAQSLNRSSSPNLIVDKLCDPSGTSPAWSGPVSVGSYIGTSLISTGRGMVVGGYVPSATNYAIGLESGVVH